MTNPKDLQRCAEKIAAFVTSMATEEPNINTAELHMLFTLNMLSGAQTCGMSKAQVLCDVDLLWDMAAEAMDILKRVQ